MQAHTRRHIPAAFLVDAREPALWESHLQPGLLPRGKRSQAARRFTISELKGGDGYLPLGKMPDDLTFCLGERLKRGGEPLRLDKDVIRVIG